MAGGARGWGQGRSQDQGTRPLVSSIPTPDRNEGDLDTHLPPSG